MPANKLIETLKEMCTERGISELWANFIICIIMLTLVTTTHEVCHILTARFLGCDGDLVKMSVITGLSAINCDASENKDFKLIMVALSAPIILWLLGLYLWFLNGKNSLLRVWALLCWFYGSIPSLSFWIAESDAQFAVKHGLPLLWALLLFIIPTSIAFLLISREITEKRWIFTNY